MHFIGTYECRIDVKGRVKVPLSLKTQLDVFAPDDFVLKRSIFQPCLELYPMNQWLVLMERLNKLNRFKKQNNDFIRRFTAGVKVVRLDAVGRLLIPKDLSAFAAIDKDIVLCSAISVLEIWDKQKYEQVLSADVDDFAALAEKVMGQDDDRIS